MLSERNIAQLVWKAPRVADDAVNIAVFFEKNKNAAKMLFVKNKQDKPDMIWVEFVDLFGHGCLFWMFVTSKYQEKAKCFTLNFFFQKWNIPTWNATYRVKLNPNNDYYE